MPNPTRAREPKDPKARPTPERDQDARAATRATPPDGDDDMLEPDDRVDELDDDVTDDDWPPQGVVPARK
jgi:hypothetical protein